MIIENIERELWKLLFMLAKGRVQNEEAILLNFIKGAQEGLKNISQADDQWFMEGKLYLHCHSTHLTFETDVHGTTYTEVQEEPRVLRAIHDWPQLMPGTSVEQPEMDGDGDIDMVGTNNLSVQEQELGLGQENEQGNEPEQAVAGNMPREDIEMDDASQEEAQDKITAQGDGVQVDEAMVGHSDAGMEESNVRLPTPTSPCDMSEEDAQDNITAQGDGSQVDDIMTRHSDAGMEDSSVRTSAPAPQHGVSLVRPNQAGGSRYNPRPPMLVQETKASLVVGGGGDDGDDGDDDDDDDDEEEEEEDEDEEDEEQLVKTRAQMRGKKSATFVADEEDEEEEEEEPVMPPPGQKKRPRTPDSPKVNTKREDHHKRQKLLMKANDVPDRILVYIDLTKEYVRYPELPMLIFLIFQFQDELEESSILPTGIQRHILNEVPLWAHGNTDKYHPYHPSLAVS